MLFYGIIAGITFLIYSRLDQKLQQIAEQAAHMSTEEKKSAKSFLKQFDRGKTRQVEFTSVPSPEPARARDGTGERVADADAAERDPADAAGLNLDPSANPVASHDDSASVISPTSVVII
jgi:hypothetical protein